jgi:hypothetical protein
MTTKNINQTSRETGTLCVSNFDNFASTLIYMNFPEGVKNWLKMAPSSDPGVALSSFLT